MSPQSSHQPLAKRLTVVVCFIIMPLILLALVLIQPAVAQQPKHYDELTFQPLPAINIPAYSRFQLDNGLVVYLMEDHELPLVSGTALIRTGSRLEPAAQVGLAGITANVVRSGGSQTKRPDQINQFLEQRAAAIEVGASETSGSARFSSLSEDLEPVFRLFAEVLQKPAFDQAQLDLVKTQIQGGIARRNDDSDGIGSREFEKLIYGSDSPYARQVEYNHLDRITRPDLVRFHQQAFYPKNMLLGIVGDFDSARMRQLVETTLGAWKNPSEVTNPTLPSVQQAQTNGIFLVDQPQLTQSNIRFGHLGGQVNSPDYPALSVMNGVLNGFGGRLFNNIRSRQGLAYSVYAAWSPRYDYPGIFVAGGQTRSDTTVAFIQSVRAEIQRLRQEPISPSELQYAKDAVLNSFIFNFQDPEQTLSRLMTYEYYQYPADFIFQYRKAVEQTTIADIQRVAKTYLQPTQLTTLVVGNVNTLKPTLLTLGEPVTSIDVTIPPKQPN